MSSETITVGLGERAYDIHVGARARAPAPRSALIMSRKASTKCPESGSRAIH